MSVRKLLLFDIDGTLILTGGAGIRAMSLAFHDLFGRGNGLIGVEVAGRIDMAILRAALDKHAMDAKDFPRIVERFRDAYTRHLAHTLSEAEGG
ncbi:MAG: hypothetical protein ABSG55_10260, partial [Dehalococcoidia bacterium]